MQKLLSSVFNDLDQDERSNRVRKIIPECTSIRLQERNDKKYIEFYMNSEFLNRHGIRSIGSDLTFEMEENGQVIICLPDIYTPEMYKTLYKDMYKRIHVCKENAEEYTACIEKMESYHTDIGAIWYYMCKLGFSLSERVSFIFRNMIFSNTRMKKSSILRNLYRTLDSENAKMKNIVEFLDRRFQELEHNMNAISEQIVPYIKSCGLSEVKIRYVNEFDGSSTGIITPELFNKKRITIRDLVV